MSLKDDIALLVMVPVFADLSDEQLRLLAFGAEHRRVAKGQALFRQGAEADCAYVVSDGGFILTISDRETDGRAVGEAGRGTLLGELAMVEPIARRFTAEASQDSEVIRITRPLFSRMLEEYPDIASLMLRRVKGNLGRLIADLEKIEPRLRR